MSDQETSQMQYVKLNVGGKLFQTTVDTLSKCDSMLRTMVTGELKSVTEQGWILIDRSGKHFGTVLNYLRDGSVPLSSDVTHIEELLAEAQYYLIDPLILVCQQAIEQKKQQPQVTSNVIVISSPQEEKQIIASTKLVVKLILNKSCQSSYTATSDSNFLKNFELLYKLSLRFRDRAKFIIDVLSKNTPCQWDFFANGKKCAEVSCISCAYVSNNYNVKEYDVKLPEAEIYKNVLEIVLNT